jgi:hypothetical protein
MSFLSSPSRTRGHLLPPPHREVSSQLPRPPWPPSRPRSRPVSPPVPPGCLPWETNQRGGENWPRR